MQTFDDEQTSPITSASPINQEPRCDKPETCNSSSPTRLQGHNPDQSHALDKNRIVKHIMVIGFHHKHGYQVDYCYPPLTEDGPVFSTPTKPITLPSCWKTLPLLCLPDGSHNYDSDTIYFTMPDDEQHHRDLKENNEQPTSQTYQSKSGEGIKTIFGTACYRQIQVDKLLNKTDDMTRLAVQKSVCVLSTQPLFGLIRSKLEMITHAYFEELDFSKVRILKLTYDNLNSLLARDSVRENATYLGLSVRHLVSQFGCNTLVLFKAMLLEKKILFYKSPVRDLCSTIMSMCSLFTGLLECGGLDNSTCDLQLSPNLLEALKLLPSPTPVDKRETQNESRVLFSPAKEEVVILNNLNFVPNNSNENDLGNAHSITDTLSFNEKDNDNHEMTSVKTNQDESQKTAEELEGTGEYEVINHSSSEEDQKDNFDDSLIEETIIDDPYAHQLCQMRPEDCGLPLQIFTRGSFCLPYLSISYLDLLSDTRVRGFVIGATNFLFKQRRDMYDVIVDMEENTIIVNDAALKRCLSLTIEDLRFMDYLSRHVKIDLNQSDDFDPINHDVTRWIGGDEWIRYHFRLYTMYLMKATKSQTNLDSFNTYFVQAWNHSTNNYRVWDAMGKSSVLEKLQAKHPFSSLGKGPINFSDMKLKLSYAVSSSERGRIVNQTLNGIGKWSIWNKIASAGNLAATTVSTLASSAATQTSAVVANATLGDKQTDSHRRQETSGNK